MTIQSPSTSRIAIWFRRLYSAVLLVIGIALICGGVLLISEGGSPYYCITGLAVVASGAFLWRGDRRGAWFYCAMLVATVAWSIWEVGFEPWELVPRLVAPFVLGFGILFVPCDAEVVVPGLLRRFGGWPAFVVAVVLAVPVGAELNALGPDRPIDPMWQTGGRVPVPQPLAQPLATIDGTDWRHFGNDAGGTRFSPLQDINVDNVSGLQVAWEAETGPAIPGPTGGLEATPIVVGDTVYVCNGYNSIVAFDADTGQERWRHAMTGSTESGKPCRGVSYYQVPNATGPCAERIFAPSQAPDLIAVDAHTGQSCPGFGQNGHVSLMDGLGEFSFGLYYLSSPPQVIRGKVVVGGAVLDNQLWGAPSGVVRAYDAVTGELAWAFDVGRPDRRVAPPEGETYTLSTPNSWAPMSADERLGLVYLPTGNSSPDFFGGNRRPFDDEFNSSVVAVDVATGGVRWHFQTTHHDLWDYDVPSQPTLVDMPTANGIRPALIQPTKRGEMFVLDRETGEPLKPVEERPVPQGGIVPEERLSPTQPFSVGMPAFRGADLQERDMWGITPIDQMLCRLTFRKARYEGTLTPIGLDRQTVVQPGYGGGVNWGSISVDVDRGIMLVNSMRLRILTQLLTRRQADERGFKIVSGKGPNSGPRGPMVNTPYAVQIAPFLSVLGTPCTAPPWGIMSAVDLSSGRMIWTKPFGTARDSGPFGIPSKLPITMGVPFSGGTVTTRGGLVFVAASVEQAIRAYDSSTGQEVWKARLPAGGQASPMTYKSPKSGRQFVLIAAGGKPSLNTKAGTKIIAYALPQ
ncbi:membrane-bound PQQ-dependent dehydrogenase, glucose/quinate/shikimate family [Rhizobium sp. PP-CC-3G-465]|uniref:membrane-bound PQQ-dependent dehydrogenase, glucose/quinate/shikimate family n=1 Tax=Rhizobium sp. PP-CC-3G-465 TaxID=2135648 RepID=UPI0010461E88|nr:quinoprotein glucose dehydrogenase [Rhizobium sp. PP-CC-3G-465]